MGFSIKNRIFAVIHKKGFYLPLVYVDNLIHAIIAAMTNEKSNGQVYNVIDSELVSKTRYMDGFIRKLYPDAWFLYIPYGILAALVGIQEMGCRVLGRKPVLTTYRLISSQKPVIFDSSKIIGELEWRPLFSFDEAVGKMLKDG
jgi:nucleoside-diphosphate-sugar epimerase